MKPPVRDYLVRRVMMLFVAAASAFGLLILIFWILVLLTDPMPSLWILCVFLTLSYACVFPLARRFLFRPYRETERMMELFADGYTLEGIRDLKWQLSPGTERMVLKFGEVILSENAANLTKRQAQYLAMQNQINPHFLYNTLEGIRGEALSKGNLDIAKMTETLSEFFRYTISNLENLVTLDDELTNVRNYFAIQQFRFGDRLSLKIEFENDREKNLLGSARVPKLILQPVVENSIIHGLEQRAGAGLVTISVQSTGKRLLLTVSDNGAGIEKNTLSMLNERIHNMHERYTHTQEDMGGIALVNVNSRIRLLFGEDYGMHILSMKDRGTDVKITLPYITRQMEKGLKPADKAGVLYGIDTGDPAAMPGRS